MRDPGDRGGSLGTLQGPAARASVRVKRVRRGRAPPPPLTQELLGGMSFYLTLSTELQKLQMTALNLGVAGSAAESRRREPGGLGSVELLASIAHEVNQPIAAMALNAGACRRWLQADPPNLRKALDALKLITRDAQRAGEVVSRIRRLALGEPLDLTVLNAGELIRGSAAMLREKVRQQGATLRIGPLSPALLVRGDRVQLQQVLLNLLGNALESLEAVPEATRVVRIDARVRQASLLVSIRDTGCGLDRACAGRMYEAFFTTKPGSMGLGLAICRSIIERHGGRLWATPNPKAGTTFRFTLPLHP